MTLADAAYSPTVVAGGTATQEIRVANGVSTWMVQQLSVEMPTAPVGATCAVRKNGNLVTLMIPTGDTAGEYPPIVLRPGDVMTVQWTGCTPGAVGKVYMQYDDGQV